MRQLSFLLLLLPLLNSCITPSEEKIKELDQPKKSIRNSLKVPQFGQIQYQLYKKYGFNETVEQIIEIQKCDTMISLENKLPINTNEIKSLESLDLRKLREDYEINYLPEKEINSDILINGSEYKTKKNTQVYYENGYFEIIKTENTERIIIHDTRNQLVYIEIKNNS